MEEKKIYAFYDSYCDYRHSTNKKHYYKLTEKEFNIIMWFLEKIYSSEDMHFDTIIDEKDVLHQNVLEYKEKILNTEKRKIYIFGEDSELYFAFNKSEYNFIKWLIDNSILAEWFGYPHDISHKINTISF